MRLTNSVQALLLIFTAFMIGCGGAPSPRVVPVPPESYRYRPDQPLTQEFIATGDRELGVRLPAGWVQTIDETNAPHITLWLVREDYGTSISFAPMTMDPALYRSLRDNGLLAVAKASLSLKKQAAFDSIAVERPPELFLLGSRTFAAYEYSIARGAVVIRVVVFDTGKHFVECVAMPASSSMSREEQSRLFHLQQSVLGSLVVE